MLRVVERTIDFFTNFAGFTCLKKFQKKVHSLNEHRGWNACSDAKITKSSINGNMNWFYLRKLDANAAEASKLYFTFASNNVCGFTEYIEHIQWDLRVLVRCRKLCRMQAKSNGFGKWYEKRKWMHLIGHFERGSSTNEMIRWNIRIEVMKFHFFFARWQIIQLLVCYTLHTYTRNRCQHDCEKSIVNSFQWFRRFGSNFSALKFAFHLFLWCIGSMTN